jgi:hypothetical protein
MNILPTPALDELCTLISAQIDALEDPEPLTPERLCEYQSRSEKIRGLCEQMDLTSDTETVEELTGSAA